MLNIRKVGLNNVHLNNEASKNIETSPEIRFKSASSLGNKVKIPASAIKTYNAIIKIPVEIIFARIYDFVNWFEKKGGKLGKNIGKDYAKKFKELNNNKPIELFSNKESWWYKTFEKLGNKKVGLGLAVFTLTQAFKDAVSAVLYVYGDLKNKDIPKEKRIYQAALDGVNGVCTVGLQVLCAVLFTSENSQKLLTEKLLGKKYYFQESQHGALFDAYINKVINFINVTKGTKFENLSRQKAYEIIYKHKPPKEELEKIITELGGDPIKQAIKAEKLTRGLSLFCSLVLTTIVAKRFLAYLISTPIASKAKDIPWLNPDKDKTPQPAKPESKGSYNQSVNNSTSRFSYQYRPIKELLSENKK